MVDINFIRENPDKIKEAAKNKNIDLDVDKLLEADSQRRELQAKLDSLRQEKNELAEAAKGGRPTEEAIEAGKKVKNRITELEESFNAIENRFMELMVKVPTVPSADTPVGKDDNANVQKYTWGDIPKFDFTPKTHIEIGKELDILDMEKGAKVGGYRGYYLKNEGSMLVLAFMMYAMHKMAEKAYKPMIPPTLVKGFALFGSGYFKGLDYNGEIDEIYQVATSGKEADGAVSKDKKFLVGTAEPSLLAYFSDDVLKEEDLPIRVCGYSQCYRSEIGSYGKDTKGFYRVHEFMKVEQVVISTADIEESNKLQEEMMGISREMHEELGLPYRQIQICTGDMSPGKYRAFDIDAWMPGMNRWGETGSASNFVDWQSRRLNIKYVDKEGKRKYVYMLNNTALPSPRIFIAILENYQQADGSVKIPEVLKKFMPGGLDVIKKEIIFMEQPSSANLPTKYGNFVIKVFKDLNGSEPVVIMTPALDISKPVLVRVHSECITGDTFGSYKCDCGAQKEEALKMICASGNGVFIYLRQEGRGIGLFEKIKAYKLQEDGYDTHEANIILGHKPDLREYSWAKKILEYLGVKEVRLITNNPSKISELSLLGIKIVERIPLVIKSNKYNRKYFEIKRAKFKHFFGKDLSNYFFEVSGIGSVDEVEAIGSLMEHKKLDPLLKICLGVSFDAHFLDKDDKIKNAEKFFKAADYYTGFVPILHYSFKHSTEPLADIKKIKKLMPFVHYIQLNDLESEDIETFYYAAKHFLVDFPLSDNNFALIKNESFVKEVIRKKVFILLDNSKGNGKKESIENFKGKVRNLLEIGINDIALAGGFGPDHLEPYFEMKNYFKINFSIDAESGLKTNDRLDIEKAELYLTQLLNNKIV